MCTYTHVYVHVYMNESKDGMRFYEFCSIVELKMVQIDYIMSSAISTFFCKTDLPLISDIIDDKQVDKKL